MPMGLRSAAYVCQRITNCITYIHRSFGYWSVNYLDDFGSAEPEGKAWDSYNMMGSIMHSIGAEEAPDKSVEPTTRMEFLGNTVDTIRKTLEVSETRKIELSRLLEQWKSKKWCKKKELQSLIGKLSFVTNCLWAGRIFISRLIDSLAGFAQNEHGRIPVDDEMQKDLQWWRDFLPSFNGICILWLQDCITPDALVASDASLVGGGGVYEKQYCHFKFPKSVVECTDNITQRELVTIMVVIKLWCKELYGKMIRFTTDNEASMFAINRGRTRDKFMLRCIREIAWICAQNQILIKAVHLSTKLNILPDALSRWYINAEARRIVKRNTDNSWRRRSVNADLFTFHSNW